MLSINTKRECEEENCSLDGTVDNAKQRQYKKQVQQIRKLTAHYRQQVKGLRKAWAGDESNNMEEGMDADSSMTDCKCTGFALSKRNPEKPFSTKDSLVTVTVKESEREREMPAAGYYHSHHQSMQRQFQFKGGENSTEAGVKREDHTHEKVESKFTPYCLWEGIPLAGANRGTNRFKWSHNVLQPMQLWASVVSVVNMPSLTQGQTFNTSSPEEKHTKRPRSSHLPSCSVHPPTDWEGQRLAPKGWRRDVSSATMYERYRESGAPLIPPGSNQTSGQPSRPSTSTGSNSNVKYKILTKELSLKNINTTNTCRADDCDIKFLKLKRASELESQRKPFLDPINTRPRDHWYEMKCPQFHREARRNNEHLRMMCV